MFLGFFLLSLLTHPDSKWLCSYNPPFVQAHVSIHTTKVLADRESGAARTWRPVTCCPHPCRWGGGTKDGPSSEAGRSITLPVVWPGPLLQASFWLGRRDTQSALKRINRNSNSLFTARGHVWSEGFTTSGGTRCFLFQEPPEFCGFYRRVEQPFTRKTGLCERDGGGVPQARTQALGHSQGLSPGS